MNKEERIKAAEAAYPEFPNEPKGENRYNRDIHCHKKRKAFIKGAEAEAESKWVSCSDRMPERGVCVLVYINNGAITCAHTSVKENQKTWELYGDIQAMFDVNYQHITHWQPLPHPPFNQQ